jgi:spore coat protein U-like protein
MTGVGNCRNQTGFQIKHTSASRLARLIVLAASFAAVPQIAFAAAKCDFNSHSGVSFGAYNVLDPNPNINGVGSITIHCQGGPNGPIDVSLSAGHSHSYGARVMTSGRNSLDYNLYTNTARTVVWGDGSGGSHTQTASKNGETTLSIFGKIPAAQDVGVGVYSDDITAIVNF